MKSVLELQEISESRDSVGSFDEGTLTFSTWSLGIC